MDAHYRAVLDAYMAEVEANRERDAAIVAKRMASRGFAARQRAALGLTSEDINHLIDPKGKS
jgi:hypothetical protein